MSKKACKNKKLVVTSKKGKYKCDKCSVHAKTKKDLCKPTKIVD